MKPPKFWWKAFAIALLWFWICLYIRGKLFSHDPETTADKLVGLFGFFVFALVQVIGGILLPLSMLESRYARAQDCVELPLRDWLIGLPLLALHLPGPLSQPRVRVPRVISYPISILGGLIASFMISVFGTLLLLAVTGDLS